MSFIRRRKVILAHSYRSFNPGHLAPSLWACGDSTLWQRRLVYLMVAKKQKRERKRPMSPSKAHPQ
jgi:hypothetical protein